MARRPGVFTSRTKARKRAADIVFEADQRGQLRGGQGLHDLLDERRTVTAAETPLPPYSVQIVEGVADNLSKIDSLLEHWSKGGGLDRLPGVDRAVMRVAVWEMMNNAEVDAVVAIDEAVAIVKSISTERSPGFVNAVLDSVRRDLEQGEEGNTAGQVEIQEEISSSSTDADVDFDQLLDEY